MRLVTMDKVVIVLIYLYSFHKNMTTFEKINNEIEERFWNGKRVKIVHPYTKSNIKDSVIQIINSFWPYIGLRIAMYFAYQVHWLLALPLAFVNAFFLVRIFIIQHDCGHNSFFNAWKHNAALGKICSFFSTIPFAYRARVHHFHHGHTGQLEARDIGDIDFLTVEEYKNASWIKRTLYKWFRHPICLFFIVPIAYFWFYMRFPSTWLKSMKRKIKRKQLWNNILIALLYIGLALILWRSVFLFIQGTTLLFFSIIAFWFFYVQHQHEEAYNQWKWKWSFVVASLRGATYYKLPQPFQWLTWNIWLHHIHHLSSSIPNYNLQKCMDENPFLNKYVTTLWFIESLKCMKNKLWDEAQQRMISFKEFREKYKE